MRTYVSQPLVFASPRSLKVSPHPSLGHRASLLLLLLFLLLLFFPLLLLPPPWEPQCDCRTSPAQTPVLMLLLSFQAHPSVKQGLPETSPKAGSRWVPPHRAAPWETGFSPLVSISLCPPVPVPTRAAMGPRLECLMGGIPRSGHKVSFVNPNLFTSFTESVCSSPAPQIYLSPAPLTVA